MQEEKQKGPNIIFILFAIIIGGGLLKQIDFKTISVAKPWLALVYGITFIMCLYFIFKKK